MSRLELSVNLDEIRSESEREWFAVDSSEILRPSVRIESDFPSLLLTQPRLDMVSHEASGEPTVLEGVDLNLRELPHSPG